MTDSDPTYRKSAFANAFALGAFAVVTALILGSVYVATKDRIEASRKLAEQQALLEVIGNFPHDNELLSDQLALTTNERAFLNIEESSQAYVIRYEGETTGYIFPATAPDAYSGDIDMLIGMNTEGEVLGVRVVEHKETPGLGDKVDLKKSDWILSFAGKSLRNPRPSGWAVTKDGGEFDGFTGATITPRAVVNRVRSVLEHFEAKQNQLKDRAVLVSQDKEDDDFSATNGAGSIDVDD